MGGELAKLVKVCVCVCVCVSESERERERVCVCDRERERERTSERERERERTARWAASSPNSSRCQTLPLGPPYDPRYSPTVGS